LSSKSKKARSKPEREEPPPESELDEGETSRDDEGTEAEEAAADGVKRARRTPDRPPVLLKWLFYVVWLFAVPSALAIGMVRLLEPEPFDLDAGPIRTFIGEQQVPAVIMFFTVFAMLLWRLRYALPFSASLGLVGRSDVPPKLRAKFDDGQQLLVEARRIMLERKSELKRYLKPSQRDALEGALDKLDDAIHAEEIDESEFLSAHARATQLVDEHLGRWRKGELREYGESIGVAVAVALILRFFVIEAFKIPSGSMIPTLMIGDHIFVAKYAYGPLLPRSDTRLYNNLPPARGDVMVFKYPEKKQQDFIKRVIALPGDKLEVVDGRPVINDWLVPNCYVGKIDEVKATGHLYVEYLGEATYLTLFNKKLPSNPCKRDSQCPRGGSCRGGACGLLQGPFRVKEAEAWVMGDNRNNSHDSRMWRGGLGAGVPFENIKGRAMFVWFSWDQSTRLAPERLGVNVMGAPKLPDGATPELKTALSKCMRERPSVADSTPPPPKNPL